ncbi:BnaC04g01780D [Brassica napus]|uniref:BnaC04g01780D protein n=1 Tax=Brassica napus TaxID=3708 RepID=A0A078GEV3_BRANA|nr:late embryogenesis abundant protein M17-like [Brassica napus]CDY23859.1 BnaC04g01780D [Brassica napus]
MGSLKSLVILALLFSLSLAVFADTSNDASTPKDEVKPSEATDAIGQHQPQAAEAETEANDVVVEPQQRVRCGCINGCCGICRYGRCSYCCPRPQSEEAVETEAIDANFVEPQQGGRCGCRYRCCGICHYGRCSYCCPRAQAEAEVVEPQQRSRCRYGCCGSYAYGQCSACCSKKMATEEAEKKEEAKP